MLCPSCSRRQRHSMYVSHLLWLRSLVRGGYRFGPNDLPVATWEDMGVLEDVVDSMRPSLW